MASALKSDTSSDAAAASFTRLHKPGLEAADNCGIEAGMIKLIQSPDSQTSRRCHLINGDLRMDLLALQNSQRPHHSLHCNLLGLFGIQSHLDPARHHRVDETHDVGDSAAG